MTLLDAPTYDTAKAHKRKNFMVAGLIAFVLLAVASWYFWNWPQEHRVNEFFAAIESRDLRSFALPPSLIPLTHPASSFSKLAGSSTFAHFWLRSI
jgi:hypothetical protein